MTGTSLLLNRFHRAPGSLGAIDSEVAAHLIASTSDVALVVDADGIIRDLSLGDLGPATAAVRRWLDMPWIETVTQDSRHKVELLLSEARAGAETVRSRELNHRADGPTGLSMRFSAFRLGGEGRILAMGRDQRPIAALQQQLVTAQQSMEREYSRLRQAETRYRLLFQVSSEGVLIVDAATSRIVESNPAAAAILLLPADALAKQSLSSLFSAESAGPVEAMLSSLKALGRNTEVPVQVAGGGHTILLSASLFRQGGSSYYLLRLSSSDQPPSDPQNSRVLGMLARIPDGFVVIDADRRVLMANAAFVEMVQLATDAQVRGQPIERWVGRPGVDLNLMLATMREHGMVRSFGTIIRGEYGANEEAEVSGVAASFEGEQCMGFVIRGAPPRALRQQPDVLSIPRSVEQLTGLVGRVSLKEIVRESTDLIERLCIEAALEVSGDNRASAAQMLGLSRQSLYSKLRRHGLGDLDPDPEGPA